MGWVSSGGWSNAALYLFTMNTILVKEHESERTRLVNREDHDPVEWRCCTGEAEPPAVQKEVKSILKAVESSGQVRSHQGV